MQAQRARELLEKVVALAPNDVSDMFQVAVAYEQIGDRKRSIALAVGFDFGVVRHDPVG